MCLCRFFRRFYICIFLNLLKIAIFQSPVHLSRHSPAARWEWKFETMIFFCFCFALQKDELRTYAHLEELLATWPFFLLMMVWWNLMCANRDTFYSASIHRRNHLRLCVAAAPIWLFDFMDLRSLMIISFSFKILFLSRCYPIEINTFLVVFFFQMFVCCFFYISASYLKKFKLLLIVCSSPYCNECECWFSVKSVSPLLPLVCFLCCVIYWFCCSVELVISSSI